MHRWTHGRMHAWMNRTKPLSLRPCYVWWRHEKLIKCTFATACSQHTDKVFITQQPGLCDRCFGHDWYFKKHWFTNTEHQGTYHMQIIATKLPNTQPDRDSSHTSQRTTKLATISPRNQWNQPLHVKCTTFIKTTEFSQTWEGFLLFTTHLIFYKFLTHTPNTERCN